MTRLSIRFLGIRHQVSGLRYVELNYNDKDNKRITGSHWSSASPHQSVSVSVSRLHIFDGFLSPLPFVSFLFHTLPCVSSLPSVPLPLPFVHQEHLTALRRLPDAYPYGNPTTLTLTLTLTLNTPHLHVHDSHHNSINLI